MMSVNKPQLGSHLDVVNVFVKRWADFVQLDAGHFVYSKCEFVDHLSDAFRLHGGNYATSINMQTADMTIYDMSTDRVFRFDIKSPSAECGYSLEWDLLYTGSTPI